MTLRSLERAVLEPVPYVGIGCRAAAGEIGREIDRHLPKLGAQYGEVVRGALSTRFRSWSEEGGEVEFAFQVEAPVEVSGEFLSGHFAGGEVLRAIHAGSYDGLPEAWAELLAWADEHGLQARDVSWESYLSDCSEVAEANLETQLTLPVEAK